MSYIYKRQNTEDYCCVLTFYLLAVQEKWRIRQEETRLRVAQSSLEQERLRLTETIQRERLDLEAAKVGVFHLIVRCVE